jgi:HEAT repeat protein
MQRVACLAAILCGCTLADSVRGQTPFLWLGTPPSLGALIKEASSILVLEVTKVEHGNACITFKVSSRLKGQYSRAEIAYFFNRSETDPKLQDVFAWAKPGRTAIFFCKDKDFLVCLGNFWYGGVAKAGSGIVMSHDPSLAEVYLGSAERLRDHVAAILAGREVIITARIAADASLYDGTRHPIPRDWRHGRKGRICRIRASLKLDSVTPSEESSHFVGWGIGGPEVVPGLLASLQRWDSLVRAEAVEDLSQLGSEARAAIPALRAALEDRDGHVRVYAAQALTRVQPDAPVALGVIDEALKAEDSSLRTAALAALAGLGPRGGPSLEPLLTVLRRDRNTGVRAVAAYALGQIGPEAKNPACPPERVVTDLSWTLQADKDGEVRFWAVRALLQFGSHAWIAAPALAQALRDGHGNIGVWAAEVLARLSPPPVEILSDALRDPDGTWGYQILGQLEHLGPSARAALPAVRKALLDEDSDHRLLAVLALLQMDRSTAVKEAVPVLGALLKVRPDSFMRRDQVFSTLAALGPEAADAAAILREVLLKDQDLEGRHQALSTLVKMGPGAKGARAALRAFVRGDKTHRRMLAAQALWQSGAQQEALPVLLQGLGDNADQIRAAAAQVVGEIGSDACQVLPSLWSALRKHPDAACPEIALAVWRVQRPVQLFGVTVDLRQPALTVLIELLQRSKSHQYSYVAGFLARIGPEAARAVPILVRSLKEEDENVQHSAASTLRAIGPQAQAAVPGLTLLLRDRRASIRLEAALALCQIVPGHPEAIAYLVQTLEKDRSHLEQIVEALIPLGSTARAVIPSVQRALRDESLEVYWLARRTLEKLDPKALARVWDVAGQRAQPRSSAAPASPQELEACWTDLASADAATAYQAIWKFALAPRETVSFFAKRLQPVAAVRQERINQFLTDLDSPRFVIRQKATAELEKNIDVAEAALRRLLASKTSLEVQRRVEQLLDQLDPAKCRRRARILRALVVLEYLDNQESLCLLQTLAQGVAQTQLTQHARASLEQRTKRANPFP